MAKRRPPLFRGRTSELNQLAQLLGQVRAGESAALVVRGEAGIGKTALIDRCAKEASGFRVARIAGIQAEMELPFAGVHQLCAPMLAEVNKLPDPQENALRVAFGLTPGDAPDRFLVALGTLSLLAEVARKRPLLCIVDDAQWLDGASIQVFGFVARRILAESVLMVFAIREPTADRHLAGLPELRLSGLTSDDARSLLGAAIPGRVDPGIQDRLIAETRGNPLALLELPQGMTAPELAGGFAVPDSNDLSGQLEEHFLRRIEALPEATQRLMLVAAADPTGDVALLRRAAQTLGIERDAAGFDGAEQLIEIGSSVRFRHPLVRSAIYSGARPLERRTVHAALAAATDPETDLDRQVWHRALAAAGPDEEIAIELERSASRAQSRGGLAAAAAFLQRAATLTLDPLRRTGRALAATQAQLQAGAVEAALHLLDTVEVDAQNELQRARIELLRGQIASVTSPGTQATAQLLRAARRIEGFDINLARDTYLDAWGAALFAGQLDGNDRLHEVCNAAQRAPTSSESGRLSDQLLDGLSLVVTEGRALAAPILRRAAHAFATEEISIEKSFRLGTLAAVAATILWDFECLTAIMARQSELARRAGALSALSFTLNGNVHVAAWRGDLAAATELAAEADVVTEATGIRQAPMGSLFLAALIGDEPQSSQFIEAAMSASRSRGEGFSLQVGRWAGSVLSNGLSRHEEALALSLQASQEAPELFVAGWALPELIEAAVRTGDKVLAANALTRLAESTESSESNWARGIFSRSQALLSDSDTAEQHYVAAVEYFESSALRPEHARSHLLFGEWLRRQKRRRDARDQLRRAHAMFEDIGMLAFAERARRELRATGETLRKRIEDPRHDLTPQEEQIARLAVEGKSNPEIGAQLFLSARTVEWHLRKVYMKLEITSRRDLRDALPARVGAGRGD